MRHLYDMLTGGEISRPGVGGEGEEARAFVQKILANAENIRLEIDTHRQSRDLYNRRLAYIIVQTPEGEVNLNEELIRAGYSSYNTDFGRSTRFHSKFSAAQLEAQTQRRGKWGGQAPGPVHFYDQATRSPAANVLGTFGRDAIDIVDADTLSLGVYGDVRFLNVQAAEVSSYDTGRQNRNSHQHHMWRLQAFTGKSASIGWQGIRRSYPTSPGQFEAMKRHPVYDFPGGRTSYFHRIREGLDELAGLPTWLRREGHDVPMWLGEEGTASSLFRHLQGDPAGIKAVRSFAARIPGIKPLAAGQEAVAYQFGDRVLRFGQMGMIPGSPLSRPKLRGMLQAFKTKTWQTPGKDPWVLEVLPRAKVARGINLESEAVLNLHVQLAKQGHVFWDTGGRNLGWHGGHLQVIDPGAVRKITERDLKQLGIRPPMGGHAPHMPKWDVMKPHPPDFPGGRSQGQWKPHQVAYLDIEAQGLTTFSETYDVASGKWLRKRRSPFDPLRISEVAYAPASAIKNGGFSYRSGIVDGADGLHIHTWLSGTFDEALLNDFTDADMADLQAGRKNAKVDKAINAMSASPDSYGSNSQPKGLWDPATRVHQSVPNTGARRVLLEALESKRGGKAAYTSFKDVAGALVSHWKNADHGITIAAWNVDYDFTTLMRAIYESGHTEVSDLVRTGKVQPLEVGTSLHEIRFNRMWADEAYSTQITDRAKLKAAVGREIIDFAPHEITKGGRHYGVIKYNQPLRELVDDLKYDKVRQRMLGWLDAQNLTGNEFKAAESHASRWANRLSGTDQATDFMTILREAAAKEESFVAGPWKMDDAGQVISQPMSDVEMMNQWYRTADDTHISLFGDTKKYGQLVGMNMGVPMAGVQSPFAFGLGGRLGDVVEIMAEHHEELGIPAANAQRYQAFMETAAKQDIVTSQGHQGFYDVKIAAIAEEDMARVLQNDEQTHVWNKLENEYADSQNARRATQLAHDYVGAAGVDDVHARAAEKQAARQGRKWKGLNGLEGKGGVLKTAAALLTVGYFLGSHNREKEERTTSFIEGIRQPSSDWAGPHGIEPSEMPFSNLSVYSSGRDNEKAPPPAEAVAGKHNLLDEATENIARSGMSTTDGHDPMPQIAPPRRMLEPRELEGVDPGPPTLVNGPQPQITHKSVNLDRAQYAPRRGRTPEILDSQPGPRIQSEGTGPEGEQSFSWDAVDKKDTKGGRPRTGCIPLTHGHAGLGTHASRPDVANRSKLRDQGTQLHFHPTVPRTYRGRQKPVVSHAERQYHSSIHGGA